MMLSLFDTQAAPASGNGPSLLGALERHALQRGNHTALTFIERGDSVTANISYAALMQDVAAIAGGLAERDLIGRPVVLALPPGIRFVTALLACLRAGVLVVPGPFPPTGESRQRLGLILRDLADATILAEQADLGVDPEGKPVLLLNALLRSTSALPPMPHAAQPALIQYSSGSTRAPRGIVLSHGNIDANAAMIQEIFGTHPGSVVVNWLPPHHDMGLFGAILQPLFAGGTAVLMPPFAFIQKPIRWLQAIERHRGTMAGGPNFGYELCVRRVREEQARALDLSSLEIAFCGAEPIRATGLRAFATHFAPAGFDPAAFLPCYGLAEATLLVTSERPGTGMQEVSLATDGAAAPRMQVACGHAPSGCQISIRDPETGTPLPTEACGEIWVAGPHVAIGAWDGAASTLAPLLDAVENGSERWLRTGDIGLLAPAGLVVLDRLKDVIFLHGRNIHATDVEGAARDAAGTQVPAAAAFALTAALGREELVLLCEVPSAQRAAVGFSELGRTISDAVGQQCGFAPRIAFLPIGALPRTTSGKIRRHAARQDYAAGRLRLLAAVES